MFGIMLYYVKNNVKILLEGVLRLVFFVFWCAFHNILYLEWKHLTVIILLSLCIDLKCTDNNSSDFQSKNLIRAYIKENCIVVLIVVPNFAKL